MLFSFSSAATFILLLLQAYSVSGYNVKGLGQSARRIKSATAFHSDAAVEVVGSVDSEAAGSTTFTDHSRCLNRRNRIEEEKEEKAEAEAEKKTLFDNFSSLLDKWSDEFWSPMVSAYSRLRDDGDDNMNMSTSTDVDAAFRFNSPRRGSGRERDGKLGLERRTRSKRNSAWGLGDDRGAMTTYPPPPIASFKTQLFGFFKIIINSVLRLLYNNPLTAFVKFSLAKIFNLDSDRNVRSDVDLGERMKYLFKEIENFFANTT